MLQRRALPLFVFSLLTVGSCAGGTETGNPSFSGALSYTGYSSSPEVAVGAAQSGSLATIDNAWLSLQGVTLSQRGECGLVDDASVEIPGLGVGDHAAGAHNFTRFTASARDFCNVELPLSRVTERAQLGPAPAELEGHSILLEGRLADGTPLRILSAAAPRVVLAPAAGGFALSENEGELLMAFDFAAWLRGLDWATAEVEDGRVELSERVNAGLLAAFEANLSRGVELYRDRDGDGKLDADAELLARGE